MHLVLKQNILALNPKQVFCKNLIISFLLKKNLDLVLFHAAPQSNLQRFLLHYFKLMISLIMMIDNAVVN